MCVRHKTLQRLHLKQGRDIMNQNHQGWSGWSTKESLFFFTCPSVWKTALISSHGIVMRIGSAGWAHFRWKKFFSNHSLLQKMFEEKKKLLFGNSFWNLLVEKCHQPPHGSGHSGPHSGWGRKCVGPRGDRLDIPYFRPACADGLPGYLLDNVTMVLK